MTQILGTSALSTVFVMQRLKNNKHVNALGVPLAAILAVQKSLLGAWGYAVMAGIASTRSFVMGMLPDDENSERLRRRLSYVFAGTGIAAVGATGLFISPWNFLPMASMLAGTAASSMINSKSHIARLFHVFGNSSNATYSGAYSGSAAAGMIDLMGLSNVLTTIAENDIPQRRANGDKLSMQEKLQGYFNIVTGKESKECYLFKTSQTTDNANTATKPKPA